MIEIRKQDPIEMECSACGAIPNGLCTAPTNTSRRQVRWTHYARERAAEDAYYAAREAQVNTEHLRAIGQHLRLVP